MPDKRISDLNSLGTTDDNDYIEVYDVSEVLPINQNKKFTFLAFKNYVLTALAVALHKNTHVTGGTDAFVITDLLDAVARIGVRVANLLIGQRRHINFIAGTNVTITALDDNINEKVDVTINSTVAGNVGDITGGLNVGTGEFIFKDKVANDLRFKSIDGTGIVTVTTNGDVIEVNVPANNGEANTGSNVGTGGGVFKIKNGVDFEHRSLVSTSSVTITENPNDLTFVANDLTTINHIGGGLQIAAKTLLNTEYNTLQAGTNISIVPTLGAYVFNTTAQPNAGLNLGLGQQVFKQVNIGGVPEYRTLIAGTNTSITANANELTVNNVPIVYPNNRAIFGDNVTGLLSSYGNLERVPNIGLKYTGESYFNDGILPDPDYIFDIQKPTITQLGVTGSTGAFQIDADGTYYLSQFRRQYIPDALIHEGHSIKIENIGAGEGVKITTFAGYALGGTNIITERAGDVGIGVGTYAFNNGVVGVASFAIGVVQIPRLVIGRSLSENGKYLEFLTPEFTGINYNPNYIHIATINSENPGTIPNNPTPGIVNGKQGIRPPIAIHTSELQLRVGSTNTEKGGEFESPLQITVTDKGVVFQPLLAATALNNSLFVDNITGKLSFKDSLGVVNPLY